MSTSAMWRACGHSRASCTTARRRRRAPSRRASACSTCLRRRPCPTPEAALHELGDPILVEAKAHSSSGVHRAHDVVCAIAQHAHDGASGPLRLHTTCAHSAPALPVRAVHVTSRMFSQLAETNGNVVNVLEPARAWSRSRRAARALGEALGRCVSASDRHILPYSSHAPPSAS